MKMGSRVLLLLKGPLPARRHISFNHLKISRRVHQFSTKATPETANSLSLEPPDVPRLAETARITLTPDEVEEFAPKIRQVIDWFGQLQAADLSGVEPAIRADSEGDHLRDDIPQSFENSKGIVAAVPGYEEPYITVPKVLNS